MGKHFPKTHQLHKLFSRNTVKVSYSLLTNFKSVINGHNKNTLNGGCQHKNIAYSCNVSTPDIKPNHPHYIGLTEHTFKYRLYKHNNSFK